MYKYERESACLLRLKCFMKHFIFIKVKKGHKDNLLKCTIKIDLYRKQLRCRNLRNQLSCKKFIKREMLKLIKIIYCFKCKQLFSLMLMHVRLFKRHISNSDYISLTRCHFLFVSCKSRSKCCRNQ